MANYEKHLDEIVTEALRPLDDTDSRWKPVGRAKTQAELSWGELEINRRESRRLFLCNEYAIGGTQCRVNYVCGQGFKYQFVNRFDSVPVLPDILKMANDWLEEFDETNDLFAIETESLLRFDRDGEVFIRLFSSEIPEVRFVEPERVIGPAATTVTYRDQLGIRHDLYDWQTVLAYHIRPEVSSMESEIVDESEVIHVKGNVDSSCLRGQPTYQPVFENLRRCEDLLASMTSMAKARAKIALIMQVENFSRQKAEDVVGKLTQSVQENADGTRTQVTIEQLPIGSIMRIPTSTNVQFPNSSVGSSDYVAVLQADLRAIASSVNMPEWMFTGLADQKYSNAFVVEAPTLRAFTRLQKVFTSAFGSGRLGRRASLVWRAARMAAQHGVFPENVLELLKVECNGPTLEVRDKISEASVNGQYLDRGVKSIVGVQRELGLDPIQTAAEIEKQKPQQEPQDDNQNPFGLPAFESLELVDLDGEWYTTDAAEWVLEGRDRSHLVKKTITNKAGRKQTVYVNPNKVVAVPKTQIEKQLEKDERYSKTATAVEQVIGGKASADSIGDTLKGVRLIDLFKLKKQFGLKNSGKLKQDLIDNIAKEITELAKQRQEKQRAENRGVHKDVPFDYDVAPVGYNGRKVEGGYTDRPVFTMNSGIENDPEWMDKNYKIGDAVYQVVSKYKTKADGTNFPIKREDGADYINVLMRPLVDEQGKKYDYEPSDQDNQPGAEQAKDQSQSKDTNSNNATPGSGNVSGIDVPPTSPTPSQAEQTGFTGVAANGVRYVNGVPQKSEEEPSIANQYQVEESPKARFEADAVMRARIDSFLKEADKVKTYTDDDVFDLSSTVNDLRYEIEQAEKKALKLKGSAKLKETNRINEIRKKAIEFSDKIVEIKSSLRENLPKIRSMVVDIVKDRVKSPTKFEYLTSPEIDDDLKNVASFYSDSASAERVATFKPQIEFLASITSRADLKFTVMEKTTLGDSGRAHAHTPVGTKSGILYMPPEEWRPSVMIHELGHVLEKANPKISERVKRFLDERVGNEEPVSLKDKFPGSKLDSSELGRKDQFDKVFTEQEAYYVGKIYSDNSTEVISMGLQKLWEDPAGFARKDPEYFHFLLNTLAEANN